MRNISCSVQHINFTPHFLVAFFACTLVAFLGIDRCSDALLRQIESLSTVVPNVTVGYYVTRGDMVYSTSVVVEALGFYGMDRLMADIRQFVPMVQAVPIPASPWRPTLAISLMLKTGQRCSLAPRAGACRELDLCPITEIFQPGTRG